MAHITSDGRWIESVSPGESVAAIAQGVLEARLSRVWEFLQLAADDHPADTEPVHQLRVSTRRAAAALRAFELWLPRRRARWIGRQLRRIRRAAGNARDLDVQAARLVNRPAHHAEDDRQGIYAAIAEQFGRLRCRAQRPVVRAHARLEGREFPDRVRKLLARVRWRGAGPEPCFNQVAAASIERVTQEFFRAFRRDLARAKRLHQLRVAAKRLRYSMELFAPAYPAAFRERLYPQIERLQERFGAIVDREVARSYLREMSKRARGGVRKTLVELAAAETLDSRRERAELAADWSTARIDELRREFETLLARPPCAQHASPPSASAGAAP